MNPDGKLSPVRVTGPLAVAVLVLGLVSTVDALGIFWRDMARRDFGAFYNSGAAWNAGGSAYSAGRLDLPNLNPPSVVAIVFSPLAHLPLAAAAVIWQSLGLAAVAYCAWRVRAVTALPLPAAILAAGAFLLTVASRYVWFEGQITWLLLLPSTLGWLAFRRRQVVAAGIWLGIVIAVKPIFAVAALVLGVSVAATAALTSAGLTAAAIMVTGFAPWHEWLALGGGIPITWPLSASLWTLGARVQGVAAFDVVAWTELAPPIVAGVCVVALALATRIWFLRDADARWASAFVLALLISPLGWMYYLPLAAPALVALWRRHQWDLWLTAALGVCCIPMTIIFSAVSSNVLISATVGAAYTWALVVVVCAVGRTRFGETPSDSA